MGEMISYKSIKEVKVGSIELQGEIIDNQSWAHLRSVHIVTAKEIATTVPLAWKKIVPRLFL